MTDPKALANAAKRFPELHYEADLDKAIDNADVLLLLTEWQQYRSMDPYELGHEYHHCVFWTAATYWTLQSGGRQVGPTAVWGGRNCGEPELGVGHGVCP